MNYLKYSIQSMVIAGAILIINPDKTVEALMTIFIKKVNR